MLDGKVERRGCKYVIWRAERRLRERKEIMKGGWKTSDERRVRNEEQEWGGRLQRMVRGKTEGRGCSVVGSRGAGREDGKEHVGIE